jgi:hypothetical protein
VAIPGIGQLMIERYAKTRRERLFRASGEESVILQDSARGHFPVYLGARRSSTDERLREERQADERLREERQADERLREERQADERLREERQADLVQLRAHWSARSLQSNRVQLHECVNRFNDRNKLLTASVRESHFSPALAVVGKSRFWVTDDDDFRPFVRFIDMSLASAVKLFEFVYDEMLVPSAAEPRRSLPLTG